MERTQELLISLIAPPNHRCYLCEQECPTSEDGLCGDCRSELKLAISPAPPEGLDGLTAGLQYGDALATVFYRFKKKHGLRSLPRSIHLHPGGMACRDAAARSPPLVAGISPHL